jgi:hypothetical protein
MNVNIFFSIHSSNFNEISLWKDILLLENISYSVTFDKKIIESNKNLSFILFIIKDVEYRISNYTDLIYFIDDRELFN